MITLIITACTMSGTCEDYRLPFSEAGLTPYACAMGAPPVIAKWWESHPNLYVKKWTCRYPEQELTGI